MYVDTERFYTTNWQDFIHKEIITKYLAKVAYVLPRLITENTTNFKLSDDKIEIDYITDEGEKETKVIPFTIDITSLSISKNNTWVINGKDSGISALGKQGHQGSAGPAGPQGNPGPVGPKGQKGPRGKQGAQGNEGVKGDMGKTGPTGPKGHDGPAGPQGEKGNSGSVISIRDNRFYSNDVDTGLYSIGAVGPKGATGEKGPEGEKGADNNVKGATGPKGEMGPAGHSPQYEIINNTFYVDGNSTGLPSIGNAGQFTISDDDFNNSLLNVGLRNPVYGFSNAFKYSNFYNSPYFKQNSNQTSYMKYATYSAYINKGYIRIFYWATRTKQYPSSSNLGSMTFKVPPKDGTYEVQKMDSPSYRNHVEYYTPGYHQITCGILKCYYGDGDDDYLTIAVKGWYQNDSTSTNSSLHITIRNYTGINSKAPLDNQYDTVIAFKKVILVDNSGNPVDSINDVSRSEPLLG